MSGKLHSRWTAARLRKFIADKFGTQAKFANAYGVSQQTVSDMLTGKRKIDVQDALALDRLKELVDAGELVNN